MVKVFFQIFGALLGLLGLSCLISSVMYLLNSNDNFQVACGFVLLSATIAATFVGIVQFAKHLEKLDTKKETK